MPSFIRDLLQPAPTFPLDPYRWRRDNRTTGEKVVSGMQLAGGLVAGFLVLTLAFGGISTLPAGASAYGNYGLVVFHRHSVGNGQPMGIHWDWIFLRPGRVKESRGACIRYEPFFLDFVFQAYSDASG